MKVKVAIYSLATGPQERAPRLWFPGWVNVEYCPTPQIRSRSVDWNVAQVLTWTRSILNLNDDGYLFNVVTYVVCRCLGEVPDPKTILSLHACDTANLRTLQTNAVCSHNERFNMIKSYQIHLCPLNISKLPISFKYSISFTQVRSGSLGFPCELRALAIDVAVANGTNLSNCCFFNLRQTHIPEEGVWNQDETSLPWRLEYPKEPVFFDECWEWIVIPAGCVLTVGLHQVFSEEYTFETFPWQKLDRRW